MNKYEMTIVFNANLDEESYKAEFEKVQGIITRFDGVIEKVDEWGKRRLAYEIKKKTEGYYVVISFDGTSSTPNEIESRVRINENVIRYLIMRTDTK